MKNKVDWTPEMLEDFAAQGLSKAEVCRRLNVHQTTIGPQLKKPELAAAWERGRARLMAEGNGKFVGRSKSFSPDLDEDAEDNSEAIVLDKDVSRHRQTVLESIVRGNRLRRQILLDTGLRDAQILDALDSLVENNQIERREEPTFTAYFPAGQTPAGKIYLSHSGGESVVVSSDDFIPASTEHDGGEPVIEEKKTITNSSDRMKKTFSFNSYFSLSIELKGNIFDLEPNDGLFVNSLLMRIFEYENE